MLVHVGFPKISLIPQLEPADPDFYKIGYVRSMRAYGIEFKEGPEGFGVYASKDIEPLRRARVCEMYNSPSCMLVTMNHPVADFPYKMCY